MHRAVNMQARNLLALSTAALAAADLHNSLQSATFLNSGVVNAQDNYAYVPIACQYLEPENVTAAQSGWGLGGSCPYLYQIVGQVPPQDDCNASTATPGFDRQGGDYNAFAQPKNYWTLCESACCNDTNCMAWVYTPSAPGVFLNCVGGDHCCFLKGSQPGPMKSTIPGITSGIMNRPSPQVATPPLGLRSAVPLGGVGAGAMELRADGTFHEVTIENASPAGGAKFGTLADAMLGLRVTPQGGAASTLAIRTSPPSYASGQGVNALNYSGSYPMSRLAVGASPLAAAGITATLFAYSALKPGDLPSSAAPAITFTADVSNSGTSPVTVSLLFQLPWGGINDCARPAVAPSTSVPVTAADAAACMQTCAAALPSNCSSWTFASSGATPCTHSTGIGWPVYRKGATCGVRGGWAAPSASPGAGVTYVQGVQGGTGPSNGDITLLPIIGTSGAIATFGVSDSAADLWSAFTADGAFQAGQNGVQAGPFVGTPASVGGATLTLNIPPGSSATLSIVMAWYFPHRDHMNVDIGNLYSTLWDSSAEVAASFGSEEAQAAVVDNINAHHAVFMHPDNPMPDWIKDSAVNQMSHFRGMIAMRDGRLREFEANDCPDVDSIHNDYQRHLPYLWLFPVFERSKMIEWGAGQAADGHIWEYLGSFGLGPIDQPGGRIMGDTTTLWILELFELWRNSDDFAFLSTWWPTAVRALQWQAGAACMLHGEALGLPAQLVCTYDIIDFQQYNTTTFNSYLHFTAMRAGQEMAAVMGDASTSALASAALVKGQTTMETLLWNSTYGYWRAYTGGDAIMADCLYGLMLSVHHGLGWTSPSLAHVQSHLANELSVNGNAYGLAVVTGRHKPPPAQAAHAGKTRMAAARQSDPSERSAASLLGLVGVGADTQDDVDWMGAGPDWSYVALQAAVGAHRERTGDPHAPLPPSVLAAALDPAQRSMGQWRTGLADLWNIAGITSPADWASRASHGARTVAVQGSVYSSPSLPNGHPVTVSQGSDPALVNGLPFVTSHYGFLQTDYYLLPALTGQQTDIPGGTLTFSPLYPCPYTLPLLLAGSTGTVTCSGTNQYNVSMAFGSLVLPAGGLAVSGSAYPGLVNLGLGQSVAW